MSIAIILLAIALAMDAFAVSVGLGAKQSAAITAQTAGQNLSEPYSSPSIAYLALLTALYFGIAQGLMPLVGHLLGAALLSWVATAAPWIACIILVILGAKMLYEAFKADEPEDNGTAIDNVLSTPHTATTGVSHSLMLSLAIATSIDVMAAGFTLNLLTSNALLACLIIAVITGILSAIGVYLGKLSGTWLESKAEILGGLVLIAIGIHMVI